MVQSTIDELRQRAEQGDDDADSVYSEYVPSEQSDVFSDADVPSESSSSPEREEESPDGNQFTRRDFPDDIKVTPGMLKRFNLAYEEFLDTVTSTCAQTKSEPMLLTQPCAIRPIPQSMHDFLEHMSLIHIDEHAIDQKKMINRRLIEAHEDAHRFRNTNDPAMMAQAKSVELESQLKVFEAICDGCEAIARQQDWRRLMNLLLVTCTLLFDDNTHLLFSGKAGISRIQGLLNRLGKCWRAVFGKTNEELGFAADSQTKAELAKYLLKCQKDLNEGGYASDDKMNHFRDATFPYEPVEDQVECFELKPRNTPQKLKSSKPKRKLPAETPAKKIRPSPVLKPEAMAVQYIEAGQELDLDSPGSPCSPGSPLDRKSAQLLGESETNNASTATASSSFGMNHTVSIPSSKAPSADTDDSDVEEIKSDDDDDDGGMLTAPKSPSFHRTISIASNGDNNNILATNTPGGQQGAGPLQASDDGEENDATPRVGQGQFAREDKPVLKPIRVLQQQQPSSNSNPQTAGESAPAPAVSTSPADTPTSTTCSSHISSQAQVSQLQQQPSTTATTPLQDNNISSGSNMAAMGQTNPGYGYMMTTAQSAAASGGAAGGSGMSIPQQQQVMMSMGGHSYNMNMQNVVQPQSQMSAMHVSGGGGHQQMQSLGMPMGGMMAMGVSMQPMMQQDYASQQFLMQQQQQQHAYSMYDSGSNVMAGMGMTHPQHVAPHQQQQQTHQG